MYLMCELSRKVDGGIQNQVSWIPEKFAVKGKYLKLKEDTVWIDGWLVDSASDESLPGNILNDRSQDYKTQRKGSDIPHGYREPLISE